MLPTRDLRFVPNERQSLWSGDNLPGHAAQLSARWHVTNAGAMDMQLLNARILSPNLGPLRHPLTIHYGDGQHDTIPPDQTRDLSIIGFPVSVPKSCQRRPLRIRFELVDELGVKHRTPWITLPYVGPPAMQPTLPPGAGSVDRRPAAGDSAYPTQRSIAPFAFAKVTTFYSGAPVKMEESSDGAHRRRTAVRVAVRSDRALALA